MPHRRADVAVVEDRVRSPRVRVVSGEEHGGEGGVDPLHHSVRLGAAAHELRLGVELLDQDGSLREELPPISQFLNRILALRINLQNTLFAVFEELLDASIEAAQTAGVYDVGVETLIAESFHVAERRTVYMHAATGAETRCYRVLRKDRNRPLPVT